jgi:GNAT superfamily N-acetyltransferase
VSALRERLLGVCEEPGLWLPARERRTVAGVTLVTREDGMSAERLRVPAGGLVRAVEAVGEAARAAGRAEVTWWVGERSRPAGVAEALLGLGLAPDPSAPRLTSLTIDRPPAAARSDAGALPSAVRVGRVEDAEAYAIASSVDATAWGADDEERAARAASARREWPGLAGAGVVCFTAFLDGEPAGFGRALLTPWGVALMGGATLPGARGRGVYTALVQARWREAVARGVPRLLTSAGEMSAPILRSLGFREIGRVRLLRQVVPGAGDRS